MKKKQRRAKPTNMGSRLIRWFEKNQRPLPWRIDYDPYKVWISEVMLQQTQVFKVIPYFERWVKRFPDPAAVARADKDEVLRHWEGLGYYTRAHNLHRAAQMIVSEHEGRVPPSKEALLSLPGIGPYTASAILSLAYNQDLPVVDGNVERVVARVMDLDMPVEAGEGRKRILEAVEAWLVRGQSRSFNQALMELGATVCSPSRPQCDLCPVSADCRSLEHGTVSERPVKGLSAPLEKIAVVVGVLRRKGRIFIQKRPPKGLMAGLWEFPGGKVAPGESLQDALVREVGEELGVRVRVLGKILEIRHSYTRYRVHLHAFACAMDPPNQCIRLRAAREGRWVARDELDQFPFPSANRRLVERLEQEGNGESWSPAPLSEKESQQKGR